MVRGIAVGTRANQVGRSVVAATGEAGAGNEVDTTDLRAKHPVVTVVVGVDGRPTSGHTSVEVLAEGASVTARTGLRARSGALGIPHGPTSAGHVEVRDTVDDLGHHIAQVSGLPNAHAVLDGLVTVEFNLHVVFALTEALEGIEASLVESDRVDRIHFLFSLVVVGEGHLDAFRAVGAVEQHVDSHTIVIK